MSKALSRVEIDKIFSIFAEYNPDPKTELIYSSGYSLLVSVVLSAQTTDIAVNKATSKLYQIADSAEKMLKLSQEELEGYIKSIGLYRTKAKNILALSKILQEKYQGKVPDTIEELKTLPGVGSKTAKVVLNALYHQPLIAVDTHVFRVSNRIGIVNAKNILETEKKLNIVLPEKWRVHAHNWLVLHGRYICQARKPKCDICIVKDYCNYYKEL